MALVERLTELVEKLKDRAKEAKPVSVVVGYKANYAVYVHENLEARHTNGQAKFLEQPARTLGPELGENAKKMMAKGASLEQALYVQGLRLQRESQQLVPVLTGNLKNSAFTEIEKT